ncbi:MAG: arginine--tRNA ligase [Thermodesulfovibrionia bacterium]|nr:arginine--tRNA ligase [Thermodesulfovibrionia bacterium]
MKQEVINVVRNAIESLQKQWGLETISDIEVEIPRNETLGDVAATVAMSLAKTLNKPPRKIAEDIVNAIKTMIIPPLANGGLGGVTAEEGEGRLGIFEKIEIAGPGFINFTFKKEYFYKNLEKLLEEEHSSFRTNIGQRRKVQVEFVSANPTGPLHIGHGRGSAVGNALSNLLQAAGFDVQREYYINDAGLQVKLLGQSVYAKYCEICMDKYPYSISKNAYPFPEDGYKGDYIYKLAEELEKKYQGKLWAKDFDEISREVIDFSYQKMLELITKDLKDFGIAFDRWQSEKELYEKGKVESSLKTLSDKNFLYEKDGAMWVASTRFGDDKDRVVVKKDGEYTYFASDIAYHKDKLDRGFDTIINIWGADHHGYIPRIKSVIEAFGLPKEKFKVILIQMVTLLRHGEPVQMSKRAGEFITLREVIDEVGADTAKFIFLTRRADSHLEFDIEVAKEQSAENPVFYVQYAFARISSIFRQAIEKRVQGFEGSRVQEIDLSFLKENEEISIVKKLLQYPIVFEGAVLSFEPHRITYYLQELARLFHSYYNKHRVISEDKTLTAARLCLCKAVQIVLEEGLKILGVSAPERM